MFIGLGTPFLIKSKKSIMILKIREGMFVRLGVSGIISMSLGLSSHGSVAAAAAEEEGGDSNPLVPDGVTTPSAPVKELLRRNSVEVPRLQLNSSEMANSESDGEVIPKL